MLLKTTGHKKALFALSRASSFVPTGSPVSTLGAHSLARALGADTIAPQTREIWGVDERDSGSSGPAIAEWAYVDGSVQHGEPVPLDNDGDTHFCVRREVEAQEQLRIFLEEGVVEQTCDGPCEGVLEGFCDQAP